MSILSQFNSKVNLGKVVEDLQFDNCLVQKIVPFGQFVYTPSHSFIGNIFDLFSFNGQPLSAGSVYEEITTNKPQYLNEPVGFSEYKKQRIQTEDDINKVWSRIVLDSQTELRETKHTLIRGPKTTIQKLLYDQGYRGAAANGFGYISEDIIKKYTGFNWSVLDRIDKPILVPFYHTPKHLSYIKVLDLKDIGNKKISTSTIYQTEFNGWAGKQGKVLPSFESMCIYEGSVWNSTQDYWNNQEVDLHPDCPVGLCLEIWRQSTRTRFKQSPLGLIKENKWESRIYPHVRGLTKEQVLYIEDYFKLKDLHSYWVSLHESEYVSGNTTYYKRAEGYFMNRKGTEYQLTNFTLKLKSREKKEDSTVYIMEASQGDKSCLVELDTTYFDNFNRLKNYIRETLVDGGLEQPRFMNPEGERRLTNFIFDFFS